MYTWNVSDEVSVLHIIL